jgi:hypothetical protein
LGTGEFGADSTPEVVVDDGEDLGKGFDGGVVEVATSDGVVELRAEVAGADDDDPSGVG